MQSFQALRALPGAKRLLYRTRPSRPFLALLSLFLLVGGVLVACGTNNATPTSFVYSGVSVIRFLSWSQQSGGSLSGQWIELTENDVQNAQPAFTAGLTGSISGKTVTLSVDGSTYTGTLDQETLRINTADASGQATEQTWYAASRADYNQLVQAFTVYGHLHDALATLNATVENPPSDSSSTTYDQVVQLKANSYVTALQDEFTGVQQSSDPCDSMALAQFKASYPPPPGTFALTPYPTAQQALDHTTLAHTLASAQADWKQARATPLPTINGLPTLWVISPAVESADIQSGGAALASLERSIAKDYQAMSSLQARAESMDNQVRQIEQQHGC
jgi:hypothetical protein